MTYNIPSHITGDTWNGIDSLVLLDGETPVDLTNASIVMGVKLSVASPEVLTLTTSNGGIEITSAINGEISIPPKNINIPVGKYSWYISVTFPSGDKKTYYNGLWVIIPNITEVTEYERRNYN